MKWKLLAFLAPLVLFGGPILYINLVALGRQAAFEETVTGETAVPQPIASAGKHASMLLDNFRKRQETADVFDAEDFSRRRVLQISRPISIEEVLSPGEAVPDPEFQSLYIEARAPVLTMQQECPLLLASFARSCVAQSSQVQRNDDGSYTLKARLAFIQAADTGPLPDAIPEDLIVEKIVLPREFARKALSPKQVLEAKSLFFDVTTETCAAQQDAYGNCVVRSVDFEIRTHRDDPDLFSVSGRARLESIPNASESIKLTEAAGTSSGLASRFAKLKASLLGGGDDQTAKKSSNKPKILRGGSAFRKAGEGRFVQAPSR